MVEEVLYNCLAYRGLLALMASFPAKNNHEEYLRTCLVYVRDGENHWFSPFIVIDDSSVTHKSVVNNNY